MFRSLRVERMNFEASRHARIMQGPRGKGIDSNVVRNHRQRPQGFTEGDGWRRGQRTWRRLEALREAGRLRLAGPFPAIDSEDPGPSGFSGSLIVAEFPSLAEARAWAELDPYLEAGVYSGVDVRPLKIVLP
jgi:uncharacterized protein YciI